MPDTIFSPDRLYRYTLWRDWAPLFPGYAMFIGLNPSTADEVLDDPTVCRCIAFAKAWGYGSMCMTNIFAYRSTNPKALRTISDPIGPDNDRHLIECARSAGVIVAAWGRNGRYKNREQEIVKLLDGVADLKCLRTTKAGHPSHPLYLPKSLTPTPWKHNPNI